MVTSGKDWRKAREEGFEITFPDGKTARLRPIDVDFIVRNGRIPDVLAGMMADLIDGKRVEKVVPPVTALQERLDWLTFLNDLCKFAFVSPKVVDTPQTDEEISVDDLSYSEKFIVYQFFAQPAEILRRFPETQAELVAIVDAAKNNGKASQPNPKDKAVGKPAARSA